MSADHSRQRHSPARSAALGGGPSERGEPTLTRTAISATLHCLTGATQRH
jgi:hypothetical protein